VVLDPFCGSGTTCVAARRTGRRYVGYEINPDYCCLAERRVREVESGQVRLDLAEVGAEVR